MKKQDYSNRSHMHPTYRINNGLIVPGVTSITGILGFATEQLIYWGWDIGIQGIDYKVFRRELADIGTLTHKMIINHFYGKETDTKEYSHTIIDTAENSLIKLYEWEKNHELEPIFLEKSFVSEKHKFGGTLDFYGYVDKKLTLADFKTGTRIYEDNFIQLAGYELLLNEANHKIERRMILHLPRDEREGYREFSRPDLIAETIIFLTAKRIYDIKKILDKRRK